VLGKHVQEIKRGKVVKKTKKKCKVKGLSKGPSNIRTLAGTFQYEPGPGPGLDFTAPSFDFTYAGLPDDSGVEGGTTPSGGITPGKTPPPPPPPCSDEVEDANYCGGGGDEPNPKTEPDDWFCDAEELCFDQDDDHDDDDADIELCDEAESPDGCTKMAAKVTPLIIDDYSSAPMTEKEQREAWDRLRRKSDEIKRTAGPSNTSELDLDPDEVWARTLGPLVRPTNPQWEAPQEELSDEEVLRIAFGAAPIDPMSPDHQRVPSGGGGMPVSPTDPGTAGTPGQRQSAFAPAFARTSPLAQMEDE